MELVPKELRFEAIDMLSQFDIVDWSFTVNRDKTGVQVLISPNISRAAFWYINVLCSLSLITV